MFHKIQENKRQDVNYYLTCFWSPYQRLLFLIINATREKHLKYHNDMQCISDVMIHVIKTKNKITPKTKNHEKTHYSNKLTQRMLLSFYFFKFTEIVIQLIWKCDQCFGYFYIICYNIREITINT